MRLLAYPLLTCLLTTMISILSIALVSFIVSISSCHERPGYPTLTLTDVVNTRPIIGILSQTAVNDIRSDMTPIPNTASIQASYVKWLEAAGARVVPVLINQTESYYDRLYSSLNGVLLPGGPQNEHTLLKSATGKASNYFYARSIEGFDKTGDYFPIWATCQGFELLSQMTSKNDLLANTDDTAAINLPLTLYKSYKDSRLFGPDNMPSDILNILTTERVTANYHHWSITIKNFTSDTDLTKFYQILSSNRDNNGVEFVSTIEAYRYPIYSTQWHPEMNLFDWSLKQESHHSLNAVRISQHFANFFVNEARKNQHKFISKEEEASHLIYNYSPVNDGNIVDGSQMYYFKV